MTTSRKKNAQKSSMAMTREEKLKEPKPALNQDCSSDSKKKSCATEGFKENATTTTWDHQFEHRAHDSCQSMDDDIEDIDDLIQLAALADDSEAISHFVMESPMESDKHPSDVWRFNHNNVIDVFQSAKETQQELSKSNHMKVKAPPAMMNLYQYSMLANNRSEIPEVQPQKERNVAQVDPPPTDNKHREDRIVARYGCAQPTHHTTRTTALFEEKGTSQSSHRARKRPFGNAPDNFSKEKSRQKNGMDKTRSDKRLESGLAMLTRQNMDDEPTLKNVENQNEKDLHRQKAALAYAPPSELPTRQVQAMERTIPPDLPSAIALIQTHEARPGAYAIAQSGSAGETTRLSFSHEGWSGRHDFNEGAQHDVEGNSHSQEQRHDQIDIDEGQIGTNENNPLEAETIESIFAEVVVWYKQPLCRWILVVVVVIVIAIIVLGIRLRIASSPPTLAPTMLTAESIACSFLYISMDDCQDIKRADGSQSSPTIPSELGVLTQLTYLDLSLNKLTGTIPSEMGALTSLNNLFLNGNQLSGTIPSEIGALTRLAQLSLENNTLTGTIPSEMGTMTSSSFLSISSNQLNGTIPSEMGAITRLTNLDLDSNQLTGTIPSEMGALTNLDGLYLSLNQLTGTIPSELSNVYFVSKIALYNNSLSGTMSTELCESGAHIVIDCSEIECTCCFSSSQDDTPCN